MRSLSLSPFARLAIAVASIGLASALAACGDDTGGGAGGTGGTGGSASSSSSSSGTASNPYDTADKINAYLDGKTLTMAGADIPSHPNGFDENVNFGQATQCYNKTVMTPAAQAWHVVSTLGTLNNAPNTGDTGTCDNATAGVEVAFDSTAILVENVSATCFDFTATYVGFGQEGRGSISADGKTVKLELFFSGQATGHRCADGAVGATGVMIKGAAFSGNAVQTYQVK